jgi:hypothetical protein
VRVPRAAPGAAPRRLLLGALASLALAALLLVGGPFTGDAQAASAKAGPVCGGNAVRTLTFKGGRTVVYRKGKYVCAVTVAARQGTRRAMSVGVQARGSRAVLDAGRYTYRAGPVTVHAGHRCVRVTGRVGSNTVKSGWILC